MTAYYNEIDPKAAAWLRELIVAGLIAEGEVDERSIADVRADDLRGYVQCHFFAGIGVWSYALRLAGWDDAKPVWTGSCPCQPFSAAGKGDGYADERHLWPHWYRLISECNPPVIFGEQVDAAIRRGWLDDVCLSLESLGYAVGAVDFPACSVGAPHIRQRVYFVAESERGAAERQRFDLGSETRGTESKARERQRLRPDAWDGGEPVALADADGWNASAEREQRSGEQRLLASCDGRGAVADAEHAERRSISGPGEDERDRDDDGRTQAHGIAGTRSEVCGLADAEGIGLGQGRADNARRDEGTGAQGTDQLPAGSAGATGGFWRNAEWIACRDGKARPVEPGVAPLVTGATARVVKLRGYGNAINAEAARAFIEAYSEIA